MTSGGSRNRAGRKPGPLSDQTFALGSLPAEGWTGEAPDFPLPNPTTRELNVWAEAWTSPQACAWSMPSEHWRIRTVAMWVRLSVRCEAHDSSAAELAQLHRFADQIGMTTAGLREMGWKVALDETAAKREKAPEPKRSTSRSRLKSIPNVAGA